MRKKLIQRLVAQIVTAITLFYLPLFAQMTAVSTVGFKNGALTVGQKTDSLYQLPLLAGATGKVMISGGPQGTMTWANLSVNGDTVVAGTDTLFVASLISDSIAEHKTAIDSINENVNAKPDTNKIKAGWFMKITTYGNPLDSMVIASLIDTSGAVNPEFAGSMIRDSLAYYKTAVDSINQNVVGNITAIDSINTNLAAVTELDTLPGANKTGDGMYSYGTAAAITRPGYFYTQNTTQNRWVIADTSVTTRARGLAMDSVAAGAVCRFLIMGTYRNDDWNWTPGVALYSDSTISGKVNVGGQAAPKKMQSYGWAKSATVIQVWITQLLAY